MSEMQKPVNADAQKQLGDTFVLDMFNKQQEKHQELSKDAEIANLYAQLTDEREARQKAEEEVIFWKSEKTSMDSFHANAMREIAKACGEDVSDEPRFKWVYLIVSDLVKRAEAAESRIKASQGQEPINFYEVRDAEKLLEVVYLPHYVKLYSEPIIPPEVEELKREIEQRELNAKQLIAAYEKVIGENAALVRKLAEQQAALDWWDGLISESHGVSGYHLNGDIAEWDEFEFPTSGKEELTKLLEEAKRQTVPEGWKLVPIQMSDEMCDAGNIYVLNRSTLCRIWDDMLSAAPQPHKD